MLYYSKGGMKLSNIPTIREEKMYLIYALADVLGQEYTFD